MLDLKRKKIPPKIGGVAIGDANLAVYEPIEFTPICELLYEL